MRLLIGIFFAFFLFHAPAGAGSLDDAKHAVTSKGQVQDLKSERNQLPEEVARLKKEDEALVKARENPPLIRMPSSNFEALLTLPELTDGDQQDYMDGVCPRGWHLLLDFKTTRRVKEIDLVVTKRVATTDRTIYAYREDEERWRLVDRHTINGPRSSIVFSSVVRTDRIKPVPGGNVKGLDDLRIVSLSVEGYE